MTSPPILDLDSPDPDAEPARVPMRLRDVRAPLWVVALVAIGCALAGIGLTRAGEENRNRQEQLSTVRTIVSVSPTAELSGGSSLGTSGYNTMILIANTGPLPIKMVAVQSSSPGVRLTNMGGTQAVPAGAAHDVPIGLNVVCREWQLQPVLDVTMTVTSMDGAVHRQVSQLNIDGTAWLEALREDCSDSS